MAGSLSLSLICVRECLSLLWQGISLFYTFGYISHLRRVQTCTRLPDSRTRTQRHRCTHAHRQTLTATQTQAHTHRRRHTHTDADTDRHRYKHRHRHRHRHRQTQTRTQTYTPTHSHYSHTHIYTETQRTPAGTTARREGATGGHELEHVRSEGDEHAAAEATAVRRAYAILLCRLR
jgi:hypothetical protein